MMANLYKHFIFAAVIVGLAAAVSAQTRNRSSVRTRADQSAVNAEPSPTPPGKSPGPAKKNQRTEATPSGSGPVRETVPTYFYEFTQPGFTVSHVRIEHDASGKGRIMFMKRGYEEMITDPLELSPAALSRINDAMAELNFVESAEDYQYERDYSHLGNITIRRVKDGRERTAKFNWTENKFAKILADEYRRIGTQFIWMFDIQLARQNQPLEAPKLIDSLDALVRRNEISDADQMLPLLRGLSNDERIPLIARNRAAKLVARIDKSKD